MNHISRGLTRLLTIPVLLSMVMAPALAQVEKSTMWRDAVVTDINVDFGGTGFHANYHYQKCQCGDLLVQVEQDAPDSVETGDLLMIEGQTLLSRGFEGQDASISQLIQAPILMRQLVDALLNRSEPQGPYAVDSKQTWDVKEPKTDFNLNTGFATGTFSAPWSVKGTGWKTAEGHRRFELTFEFGAPTEDNPDLTSYIGFSGNLDYQDEQFPLAETTVLDGWKIQYFAAGEEVSKPVPAGLTLKALREEMKEQ